MLRADIEALGATAVAAGGASFGEPEDYGLEIRVAVTGRSELVFLLQRRTPLRALRDRVVRQECGTKHAYGRMRAKISYDVEPRCVGPESAASVIVLRLSRHAVGGWMSLCLRRTCSRMFGAPPAGMFAPEQQDQLCDLKGEQPWR